MSLHLQIRMHDIVGKEANIMSLLEEYLAQDAASGGTAHYDEHTDRWVDEAGESVYGHSGHCDVHTDD